MTTQQLYQKVLNEQMTQSEFLWTLRRDEQYKSMLTNTMSFEDTIKVLKAKGHIWEARQEGGFKAFDFMGTMRALQEGAKKQKLKGGKGDKLTADDVNYHEFTKGWKHELEHTDDIDKAKEIALDHLAEDPNYYTRLDMIEYQAKKKNRTDLPKEYKKGECTDKDNQMQKVKKISTSKSGQQKEEKIDSFKKNISNSKEKAKKPQIKTMK